MTMMFSMRDSQRQTLVLALSYLEAARPGWQSYIREIVHLLAGTRMYKEFLHHRHSERGLLMPDQPPMTDEHAYLSASWDTWHDRLTEARGVVNWFRRSPQYAQHVEQFEPVMQQTLDALSVLLDVIAIQQAEEAG